MIDLTKIEYLGLERVLRRGSGEIVADSGDALLVRDDVSGGYLLACEDAVLGASILERHVGGNCRLLMVSDHALGVEAFERYGFSEKLECWQFAYYGEKPPTGGGLSVRVAGEGDLAVLKETYRLVSPEELEMIVERGALILGYHGDRLVGFCGEHLEGSMGLLYVFPEFRRRGYGEALQRNLIARTMEAGFVPFGQVEKDNRESLCLQKKLGMTRSDGLIVWMWR